jgi:xanthine dehydrogenase accessory factor
MNRAAILCFISGANIAGCTSLDGRTRMSLTTTAVLSAALGDGATLCTLVAVEGGFSRAPGAQLCVAADGSVTGDMTGGCLEAALVSDSRAAQAAHGPLTVRYGKGSRYIDIQLPCGGGVEIRVDPRPDRVIIAQTLAALEKRETAAFSFGLSADDGLWRLETAGSPAQFDTKRFTCSFHPAPRLLVFGNGPEVRTVTELAQTWGCVIEVFFPSGSLAVDGLTLGKIPSSTVIDPFTAVILLFHDHEWEDALLRWALASDAFYIGALGGFKAVQRRTVALKEQGVSKAALARLRGPIGLIPAAKDSAMLAISILAEVAETYGRLTGRLR